MKILLVDLVLLLSCFHLVRCNNTRSDNLLPGQILSFSAADTLVSKQGKFELGFFCPGNCEKLFIGIWYTNIEPKTVVWIANRDNPIRPPFNNSHLELSDGNLQLLDARKQRVWSSSLSTSSAYANKAVLLDSGNLVLTNGIDRQWQSFNYPTDTWLPGAMIGFNKSKNTLQKLTSWRNLNDPASGSYSLQLGQNQNGELVVQHNFQEEWRSGPWNEWRSRSTDNCDRIKFCGAFGICDMNASPPCECLKGYDPKFKLDWDSRNYSGGCVRKNPLQCGSNNKKFVRMPNVKLPVSSESMKGGNDQICEYTCSSNCSCNAYAYSNSGECLLWYSDLIDLSRLPNNSSQVEFNIKLFERSNKD